ncbi:MAG: nucleotidyltransferase domain-containing protein [Candidatus Cloacimonetes bacterium]|nr:nucleotidyltransferase domain-containing protein [Candidatus Cloacimonadota bacterium]
MEIPEHIKEYLEFVVSCIKKTIPVSAIYLFGSYAIGNFHDHSDLDIYIITNDKSKRKIELKKEASKAIGFPQIIPMDILVGYEDDFIRRSNLINFVENEVVTKGIKIYASQ